MDWKAKLRKLYPDPRERAYFTVKLFSQPDGKRLEYFEDSDDECVKSTLESSFGPAPLSKATLPDAAAFFGVLKDGLGSASELAKKAKKILEDEREDMQP
ncbi:hypothetical protein WJX75_003892 [Coccomyxa subellipsoidea]|uniref:Uncharacterized protein n=1 Tax=Coccomyxa subellipsoidea TaxID=248742 RepID=A0ABR2YKQ5_9CHLO